MLLLVNYRYVRFIKKQELLHVSLCVFVNATLFWFYQTYLVARTFLFVSQMYIKSVLRIRIRRIHMFSGPLNPDPDPLVRDDLAPDPDPSIIKKK
jgi:hypothetical protein